MRAVLLTALGLVFLGIGAIGALLPVLPTTPFVLLAAGCFGVSNPRLYRRLANTRLFGPYLEHWRTGGGIPTATKVKSLLWLWGALTLSVLVTRSLHLALLLLLIGTAVTVHILLLKPRA